MTKRPHAGLALSGITVLDLGQAYMGPYCGLLLQRLGADVIKVEPLGGELYRRPSARKGTQAIQFGLINAGKGSIAIDLKTKQGKDLFIELAKTVDVVIQNFAPDTFNRLINIDMLLAANPRLILASGTGYGSSGPYAGLRAMDLTIQAISGSMATTGFPDGPPVRTGPAVVDFLGGAHLAAAVLGALVQRGVTGRGQHVEVALYDAIFPSLTSNIAAHFDSDGEIPDRTGNRHGGMAVSPYNAYPTADGWVAILCLHDRHWETLCRVMGREELATEPSFATNPARVLRMNDVDTVVSSWTATRTAAHAVAELEAVNVPCAPVKSLRDVINDPNVAQRGLLQQHIAGDQEWWTLASPLRLEDSPSPAENVPPRLGQDTDQLLSERLGMSHDAITALESAGIIMRATKSEVGAASVR